MSDPAYDHDFDARGLNCPMPLVKARKELGALEAGQVLRVVSTDRGSIKDFQGWAKIAANVELLHQEEGEEDGREIFFHYVQKTA